MFLGWDRLLHDDGPQGGYFKASRRFKSLVKCGPGCRFWVQVLGQRWDGREWSVRSLPFKIRFEA
jgi:hypothetical protein